MGHLTADELVDLAEGARAETSAPHLQTCAVCRERLSDLRSMISTATEADVPEPSPLFWDHLSARVRDAVATDEAVRSWWWRPSEWPRFAIPALTGTLAAILIATLLTSRGLAPCPAPDCSAPVVLVAPAPEPPGAVALTTDPDADPVLRLVADLAAQMDWEAASQMDLATHAGAADEALIELSDAERREMRLLLQELSKSGT